LKEAAAAAGWEIVPSVQTDLTHLFNPSGKKVEGDPSSTIIVQRQKHPNSQTDFRAHLTSNNHLRIPVPVPIPVPNIENVKSPVFLVAQDKPLIEPNSNTVRVQDVTYHEEGHDKTQRPVQVQPSAVPIRIPVVNQQNIPHQPYVFQPHFDPLPPSILTALKHAQRTSYLTHQYHNNGEKKHQETMYVNSVPVEEAFGTPFRAPQESSSGSTNVETFKDTNDNSLEDESDEKTNTKEEVAASNDDQELVNCENEQHWLHPDGSEATEATTAKPLLVYYPSPVEKPKAPPVYWLQSTRFGPGGVRYITRPAKINRNKPLEEPSSGTNQKVVFSRPVAGWENNNKEDSKDLKDEAELQSIEDVDNSDLEEKPENPTFGSTFGDKLVPKATTPLPAPFDIVSVGGKDDQLGQSSYSGKNLNSSLAFLIGFFR